MLLTSFPDQPLALACVPGAERVSSQLDANEARGTTRGRRHPPRHAVTAPVRGGAPCPRLEPPSVGVIGSIAKSFANRQIDEPHFGKTPLGCREKVARARGLHFRVRVDASCALAMPTRSFWDAVISGLSAWCPDVSSPATRAFGRARPFIASRPFSAVPVSARPRDGRGRSIRRRGERKTSARRSRRESRSDIVSLSRFVRTNPLSSLTRERPFPLVHTRVF